MNVNGVMGNLQLRMGQGAIDDRRESMKQGRSAIERAHAEREALDAQRELLEREADELLEEAKGKTGWDSFWPWARSEANILDDHQRTTLEIQAAELSSQSVRDRRADVLADLQSNKKRNDRWLRAAQEIGGERSSLVKRALSDRA